MKTKPHCKTWILLGLMALFTAMRWPGLWPDTLKGFSPVYAIFFCAGLYFRGWQVWVIPVGLMFISDLVINHWFYSVPLMGGYMLANYAMWLGIGLVGWLLRNERRTALLVGGGALGAGAFFMVTNSIAWLANPVYAKTWAGLVQSFTTGELGYPPPIVFLKNTIASGALFTLAIVAAVNYARAKETANSDFQLKT